MAVQIRTSRQGYDQLPSIVIPLKARWALRLVVNRDLDALGLSVPGLQFDMEFLIVPLERKRPFLARFPRNQRSSERCPQFFLQAIQ